MNGDHLVGILPERRKHQKRITKESIMKWVRLILGDHADLRNIFFAKVTIGEGEVGKQRLSLKRNTASGNKK
jgi:hypothetical protein